MRERRNKMNKNCLAHAGKKNKIVMVSLKGKEREGMSSMAINNKDLKLNKQEEKCQTK
jgi:hypothetical protein